MNHFSTLIGACFDSLGKTNGVPDLSSTSTSAVLYPLTEVIPGKMKSANHHAPFIAIGFGTLIFLAKALAFVTSQIAHPKLSGIERRTGSPSHFFCTHISCNVLMLMHPNRRCHSCASECPPSVFARLIVHAIISAQGASD